MTKQEKEKSDRAIMQEVRLIYQRRKSEDRTYALERLAGDMHLTRSTLYQAIMNKVASKHTINRMRDYLVDR